jgi:transposase
MSQRQTTVAERNHFIDLKQQGHTLKAIAAATGWSYETVRHWWRRFRDGGRNALAPEDGRQQRGGRMSSFPEEVREAFYQVKKAHPGWGAEVARLRLGAELDIAEEQQPSISTIEKYWAERCPDLLSSYRRHPPPPAPAAAPQITAPHERWQLDFKEWMHIEELGYVDVLNIRDEATPVKIGSFVYPARKTTGRHIQEALRLSFCRWGLCDRLQSDHDKRLFNPNHDYPFPTVVTLWLAGLGVAHDIAPSALANGCVERFHRTWFERVVRGSQFDSLQALQAASDQEVYWINYKLPCHGRDCNGQPPLTVYPQALQARRPFSRQREQELFSLQRVYDYLANRFWWRRVNKAGQISLGGQRYGVRMALAGQDVRIDFDAHTAKFVVQTAQEEVVKQLQPKQLTVDHIIGLDPETA